MRSSLSLIWVENILTFIYILYHHGIFSSMRRNSYLGKKQMGALSVAAFDCDFQVSAWHDSLMAGVKNLRPTILRILGPMKVSTGNPKHLTSSYPPQIFIQFSWCLVVGFTPHHDLNLSKRISRETPAGIWSGRSQSFIWKGGSDDSQRDGGWITSTVWIAF